MIQVGKWGRDGSHGIGTLSGYKEMPTPFGSSIGLHYVAFGEDRLRLNKTKINFAFVFDLHYLCGSIELSLITKS